MICRVFAEVVGRTRNEMLRRIWNMDETAYTWAIGPSHLFCHSSTNRAAHVGIPDPKVRMTVVVMVNALGEFAPNMLIIKHSVTAKKSPNELKMKVIQNLHKKEGFKDGDGWELKQWHQDGNSDTGYKCWYLKHTESGTIITSQHKAWNDTARMRMWIDLVVAPIKARDGEMVLWFDNCGMHTTGLITQAFKDLGVEVNNLPKNTTGILQVLDLVVNGPMKAWVRKLRATRIVEAFIKWRDGWSASYAGGAARPAAKFAPPAPTLPQAITDLLLLFRTGFKEDKFQGGIRKSFVKTGCAPKEGATDQLDFNLYEESNSTGIATVVPEGTRDELRVVAIIDAMNAVLDEPPPDDVDDDAEIADAVIGADDVSDDDDDGADVL